MFPIGAAQAGASSAWGPTQDILAGLTAPMSDIAMCDRLLSYYYGDQVVNEVLELLSRMSHDRFRVALPLKSPAYRVAEFYAGHMWPGEPDKAFKFVTDNSRLEPAVRQIWAWSNWDAKRQMVARRAAIMGRTFIKVAQSPDKQRVFFRIIDPRYVTRYLFDDQDRGYLTYARLDIPTSDIDERGDTTDAMVTEIWDKRTQTYRKWVHKHSSGASLDVLGTPDLDRPFRAFGIAFVPIVHIPFIDDGTGFGIGAYQLSTTKIDELNKMATELHGTLFRHNRAKWAITANQADKQGRRIPAPLIPGVTSPSTNGTSATDTGGVDVIEVGDEEFLSLPGMSDMHPLIPSIDYAAALAILQDYLLELEDDLPEMAWSRIRELPDASGVSIRYRLSGAIDKAIEARANMLPGLVRANQMGVTIGQNGGLFQDVGTYEEGKLEHSLTLQPVMPISEAERLESESKAIANAILKDQAGWPRETILLEYGYTQQQVDEMIEARSEQNVTAADLMRTAFARGDTVAGFDGSGNTDSGE